MVGMGDDEEGRDRRVSRREDVEYRLHRHEGAVGIVDCAIDEA